jgi:hypothetical protein
MSASELAIRAAPINSIIFPCDAEAWTCVNGERLIMINHGNDSQVVRVAVSVMPAVGVAGRYGSIFVPGALIASSNT